MTKVQAIAIPEEAAIVKEVHPYVLAAQELAVRSEEEHGRALEILKALANAERAVKEHYEEPKALAHRTHKAITTAERKILGPILQARSAVNRKVSDYEQEAERKAKEEEERLRKEALAQEQERALTEAIEASEAGDEEFAEAILEEAQSSDVVVRVDPAVSKVDGVSTQKRWHAEVVDLFALVNFVAEHKEWLHLLTPHMPSLNKMAQMQRAALSVPGVKAVCERTIAVRSS